MANRIARLSPDAEEKALDLMLEGKKLDVIAKGIGLKSKDALVRYLANYPEFASQFEATKQARAIDLEEQYLHCLNDLSVDAAKVQTGILAQYLKWLNPKKYADKQQIDLSVTVDISGSIERAAKRIESLESSNVIALIPKPVKPDGD